MAVGTASAQLATALQCATLERSPYHTSVRGLLGRGSLLVRRVRAWAGGGGNCVREFGNVLLPGTRKITSDVLSARPVVIMPCYRGLLLFAPRDGSLMLPRHPGIK